MTTSTPWDIDGDAGVLYGVAPADNGRVDICKLLHDETDPHDGQRAAEDAALMRAAPALRSALRGVMEFVDAHGSADPGNPIWRDARFALHVSENWPSPVIEFPDPYEIAARAAGWRSDGAGEIYGKLTGPDRTPETVYQNVPWRAVCLAEAIPVGFPPGFYIIRDGQNKIVDRGVFYTNVSDEIAAAGNEAWAEFETPLLGEELAAEGARLEAGRGWSLTAEDRHLFAVDGEGQTVVLYWRNGEIANTLTFVDAIDWATRHSLVPAWCAQGRHTVEFVDAAPGQ